MHRWWCLPVDGVLSYLRAEVLSYLQAKTGPTRGYGEEMQGLAVSSVAGGEPWVQPALRSSPPDS